MEETLSYKKVSAIVRTPIYRYAIVGGVAFIVDVNTLFILVNFFNINYLIATGFGFILGLSVNYYLSINWVFKKRIVANRYIEFIIFALIGIGGLFLTELLMYVFSDRLEIYYLFSKVMSVMFVFIWNYYARKIILFRERGIIPRK